MTGDLNDFCIEKATREDIPDILQFLISDFLHAEPLNVALDIKPEDASAFFEGYLNLVYYLVTSRDHQCKSGYAAELHYIQF